MDKGNKDMKYIGTVRIVPYSTMRNPPEMSYAGYMNIDVYRTRHLVILTLTDIDEKEALANINLDAEICGKLLGIVRKASRLEWTET